MGMGHLYVGLGGVLSGGEGVIHVYAVDFGTHPLRYVLNIKFYN